MLFRSLLNSMIHASTSLFPSNLGISEVFILSEGSLAGWVYGAGLFARVAGACIGGISAEVAAGATGACIGGVTAEVAAELANSWSLASRFANLCSIFCRSCDCCTSNAARLVSDCAFCWGGFGAEVEELAAGVTLEL